MDNPKLYHNVNLQQLKDGVEHLEEIKGMINWAKGEKVLDIGCGPGNFTAEFLLQFVPEDATIVGCDISQTMIDYAEKTFKEPRVTFKIMDIESEYLWDSWEKESFNKIHSLYCFHWIEKYQNAFENMYSLLKPGGEIFLLYFAEQKAFSIFTDLKMSEPWMGFIKERLYFRSYMTGSIDDHKKNTVEELELAGFKNVEVMVKNCRFRNHSLEEYIRLVRSVDPYKKYIPDHLTDEYNNFIAERVEKTGTVDPENGEFEITYSLFSVRGKKELTHR